MPLSNAERQARHRERQREDDERAGARASAVEHGRLLGEAEARSRNEPPEQADERVRRAMAYAAWEFDGRPASSAPQREEFGVGSSTVTDSLDRDVSKRLLSEAR